MKLLYYDVVRKESEKLTKFPYRIFTGKNLLVEVKAVKGIFNNYDLVP